MAEFEDNSLEDVMDVDADYFREVDFALDNQQLFDVYVELRIRGYEKQVALSHAIGGHFMGKPDRERSEAIEYNPYTVRRFNKRLAEIDIKELWNTKVSINELLKMVRDDIVKDQTRLSAIKELNVLYGITLIDEAGRTRAGRGLAEFYAEHGTPPDGEAQQQQPDDAGAADQQGGEGVGP